MLDTVAFVTFLLTSGLTKTVTVYPPGGEYHARFAHICEQNKHNVRAQVRRMYLDKKLEAPEGVETIVKIDVVCVRGTKV